MELANVVMDKIVGWIRASWKAILPIIVFGLWEIAVEVVEALQDTWADNPAVSVIAGAVVAWFKKNQPNPS